MTLRCCIREQCCQVIAAEAQDCFYFSGLAIATCCHHLCQWKNYISNPLYYLVKVLQSSIFSVLNYPQVVTCKPSYPADKRYISDLGFTKEDFHAISWFTSWAVDADHGSNFSSTECMTQQEIMYDTTFILYYSILDHTCFKGILCISL